MRRRVESAGDSLELLLDAVTNAFGGILFLAILIVILVNRTAGRMDDSPEKTQQDATRLKAEANSLKIEIDTLAQAISEQEQSLDNLKVNQGLSKYERVIDLQKEISELEQQREEFIIRNKKLLQDLASSRDARSQAEKQVQDNESRKATLEEELARLRLPQVRTAKTPRLRKTYKKEFPLILRYGRVYFPYSLDPATGGKSFNENDFLLVDDEVNIMRVSPKAYRGISVEESADFIEKLSDKLDDLDDDAFYIAIAAWSDSFAEFNTLRNEIVNLGYEYRIVPVEPGGFIQEGSIDEALIQ
jgi:hypothetical protein